MENYFSIDLSTIEAGIGHQKGNFATLIRYCFQNNLKLIKPIFTLTKWHNNGLEINSDLSEYYDINNITVNGSIFKLYDYKQEFTVSKKEYPHGQIKRDIMFSNIDRSIRVNIPYQNKITILANKIKKIINEDCLCVHVRRGDRILNKQIDEDTQPDSIINTISKNTNHKTVYIMTNRINEIINIKKQTNYKIYFYTDFEDLINIKDNYYLYCIEDEIMRMASTRCSTFNTSSWTDYYNFYLTEFYGWN